MGNCSGLFNACAGEEETAVRKINQENLQMAIARNKELEMQGQFIMQDSNMNKASNFGAVSSVPSYGNKMD